MPPRLIAADAASWIGALAGVAALGVGSAALTRFRPSFTARVDRRRQAIRLDVVNRGRATGVVSEVAVIGPTNDELPCDFAGLPDGRFQRAALDGREPKHLIIRARQNTGPFPPDVRVKVVSGRRRTKVLTPLPTNTSYYGDDLLSDWS